MVILDANILIRAVLGKRVREILERHSAIVRFFPPKPLSPCSLSVLIGCIDREIYGPFETAARQRLQKRHEEDWPVLATALALGTPAPGFIAFGPEYSLGRIEAARCRLRMFRHLSRRSARFPA
jgi:hypothetical protein